MTGGFEKELARLKEHLLFLGGSVENNLHKAIKALRDNDAGLAMEVSDNDEEIDEIEVSVEDDCLVILALQQPVARDLRFIVTVLKMNIDLERIGDLAAEVADKVFILGSRQTPFVQLAASGGVRAELDTLITDTLWMLHGALDAFAMENQEQAQRVILADEQINLTKNRIRSLLEENFCRDNNEHKHLATILSVTRSLERIADHATNICEDVIYMLSGNVIRHRGVSRAT